MRVLPLLFAVSLLALIAQAQRRVIFSPEAPPPIGPYSQAVLAGNTLYVAGQIGSIGSTGSLNNPTITAETTQVMQNIAVILKAAKMDFSNVVSVTIYLKDLADFGAVNAVYAQFFPENPPARATVQVAALPRGAAVEISCVAVE
ncbi:MAG: Rid family detoxifying hydrolase [Cytophagaceae bacterium]|nr:Rid family detoxifying hydrolase [Cytophagaceae bacterium]